MSERPPPLTNSTLRTFSEASNSQLQTQQFPSTNQISSLTQDVESQPVRVLLRCVGDGLAETMPTSGTPPECHEVPGSNQHLPSAVQDTRKMLARHEAAFRMAALTIARFYEGLRSKLLSERYCFDRISQPSLPPDTVELCLRKYVEGPSPSLRGG